MTSSFEMKLLGKEILKVGVVASCLICANSANAETSDGFFAVRGTGALTCNVLISALVGEDRENVSSQFASWVAGYLSYANRVEPDTYDVSPIQDVYGVATIAARICESNGQSLVEPILWMLINGFENSRQYAESELVTISENGQDYLIRRLVIEMVQSRLIDLGFLEAGNITGMYGPLTKAAMISFQSENDIPATGMPDAVTMFLLLNAGR